MFWYISWVLSSWCCYILLILVRNPHDWGLQLSTRVSDSTSNMRQYIAYIQIGLQVFVVVSPKLHTTLVSFLDIVVLFFSTISGNWVYSNSSLRWAEQDVLISCRSWPQPLHSFSLNPDWVISIDSKMFKVLPHEIFVLREQKICIWKSQKKNKKKICKKVASKFFILLPILSNSMILKNEIEVVQVDSIFGKNA